MILGRIRCRHRRYRHRMLCRARRRTPHLPGTYRRRRHSRNRHHSRPRHRRRHRVMSGISLRARPRIPHRRTTRGQRFRPQADLVLLLAAETAGPGEPSGPQVDPDEDEYSLSDESLGTATALSVEELSKIFEVKKVEKFAADDEERPTAQARHGVICRIAGEPITGTNWYAAHPHIRRSNCSPPHIPRLRGH